MLSLYINIKELRLLQGMSQNELAKKVGYSDKSMIAKIEAGSVDLPQSKILAFANALGTTPSELMGWDEIDDNDVAEIPQDETLGEMIELYSRATPEQKKAVLNLLRSFVS